MPRPLGPSLPPNPPNPSGSPVVAARGTLGSLGLALLLVAAVFAAYAPALRGGLLWDDNAHVTKPELRSLDGLGQIWTKPGATQQYYPLLHSAFWFEHRLWGDAVLGYHVLNVLLHAGAALLLVRLLHRLALPGAWLAGVLFALQPVHVESVAWITEQKNTLSLLLYLGSALAWLRFDELRSPRAYGAAALLFIAGLLTKSVIATLPAALLVVQWWRHGRLAWRRDVVPLLPWFVVGAASGLFTAWVEHRWIGAHGADFELGLVERGLVAGRAFWFYLGKLAWPAELIFVYPRWTIDAAVWWAWLFPAAAVGVVALAWGWRTRTRAPLAALLLFGGTLFPVLGFLNVYPFRFSYVADHFQYHASIAVLALIAAAGATRADRARPLVRRGMQAGAVVVVALLAVRTWHQSHLYRDVESLYTTTLAQNPACWMAHHNLGLLRAGARRFDEAGEHFRQALAAKPEYAIARYHLAQSLRQTGRFAEAVPEFERALRDEPENPEAHLALGNIWWRLGDHRRALGEFLQAAAQKQAWFEAHFDVGAVLLELGRPADALAAFETARRLKPDSADAANSLGIALHQTGRLDDAAVHFEAAVRLRPDFAPAQQNLGDLRTSQRRWTEAVEHYEKLVALEPDSTDAHQRLAVALRALGRDTEAARHDAWAQPPGPPDLR